MGRLFRDSVCARASVILGRFDLQPHLLRHVSADESADAVILPVGDFGDFRSRRTLLPAQEFEDDGLLRVGAGFRFWPGSLLAGGRFQDCFFEPGDFAAFLPVGLAAFLLARTFFGAVDPGFEASVVGVVVSVVMLVSPYIDVADDTLITRVRATAREF